MGLATTAVKTRMTEHGRHAKVPLMTPLHIGIAACSAEGAALCYRTICTEAPALLGAHDHPEVTMHTPSLGAYMAHIYRGDWAAVGAMMLASAEKLQRAG